jgi:rSAM/selenodomain-associated transferase 2
MLSIIIPTLDEAGQILAALSRLRAQAPRAELIVVDGGSRDATVELSRPFATVVQARRGRARQMNAGAAQASGDTLLFLHCDSRLPTGALAAIHSALADPRIVGGAFRVRFDEPGWLYGAMAWGTNQRSRWRRSYTGDQGIFVRAAIFRTLGGYPDIPLMEDLEFSRLLRETGRLRLLPLPMLVSARRHRRYGPLRVLVIGWCYQSLYALGMPPFALHRLYYGRLPEH